MATLGSLSVSLDANIVRFTEAMDRAAAITDRNMKSIERSASAMSGRVAGALTAALSVGALVAMGKEVIEATAKFKDLAEEAGTSAEAISRFEAPARMAGSSLEGVATAMFRVSQKSIEARDSSSNAAAAFRAIGISTEQIRKLKPDELFELTARSVAKYSDGVEKNAVMQELFNKSGREMSRVVGEIADKAQLAATVTNEEAAAADRLGDQMIELKMNSERLYRTLAADLVPALNDMVRAFIDGKKQAGLYRGVIDSLAEGFSHLFGGSMTDQVRKYNGEIEVLQGTLKDMAAQPWNLDLGSETDIQDQIKRLQQLRDGLLSIMHAQGLADQDQRAGSGKKGAPDFDPAAAAAARKYAAELQALYDRLDNTTAGVNERFLKELGMLEEQFDNDAMSVERYRARVEELIKTTDFGKNITKQQADAAKYANDEAEKAIALDEARLTSINDVIKGVRLDAEAQEFELKVMGLSNAERAKAIALRQLELAKIETSTEAVQQVTNRVRDAVAAQEALRNQVAVWQQLGDYAAGFAQSLMGGVKSGLEYVRNLAKQFLAEMIGIFAKRWVLSLGAALTNSSALGTAAAATGEGSLAGSVLNLGASALGMSGGLTGGLSSIIAGYQGATLAAGLAGPTTAGAAGMMGLGSTIGTAIAAIPVWGWIAAAIAAVAYAIRDKGENWQARIGFGDNARAYTTDGVFGREGFDFIQGNDTVNKAIQAFMASMVPLDKVIATYLSAEQIERIKGNLGGAYGTRADGQPATFAFDRKDESAAQQLTLEYLQKKYGTIFDEIDAKFATFIRGYTGKSEDLVKEISAFATIMQQLANMGVKGLDVSALRGMQQDGEELAATFKRIGDGWSYFVEHFTSDADKFDMIQEMVDGVFSSLNLAVPTSKDAFADLIKGLDLSTEAGRSMFQTLLAIAPAFDSVASAAKANLDAFDQLMTTLRPGYGDALNGSMLSGFLASFKGLNGWAASNTNEDLIAALKTITRDDFANYSAESQKLILSILGLTSATQLNTTATSQLVAATLPTGSSGPDIVAAQLENARRTAKIGIGDHLSSLLTSSLSPLDPMGQLEAARRTYEALLAKANTGDVDAMQQVTGAHSAYLQLAQSIYGSSSPFISIFQKTFDQLAKLADVPGYNQRMLDIQTAASKTATESAGLLREVRDLLLEIRDKDPVGDLPNRLASALDTQPPRRR